MRAIPLAEWQSATNSFILDLVMISGDMGLEEHDDGILPLLIDLMILLTSLPSVSSSKKKSPVTTMGYEDVSPTGQTGHW